ncbi:MAG: hypothetical protein ACOCUE_00195 [Candidatus Izemoplasmataceae bacterium]
MKNKDFQKIIQEDFKASTPEVLSNIHLDEITIQTPVKNKYKIYFKRLAFVPILTVLVIIGIIIIGNEGTPPEPTPDPIAFTLKEEVYSISAVSAASLLSQSLNQSSSSLSNPYLNLLSNHVFIDDDDDDDDDDNDYEDNDPSDLLINDEIDNLFASIHMIEPIIGNRDAMHFILTESELPEYDSKLIFTSLDFNNFPVDYIMYYNETILSENYSTLDGILYIDNLMYHIEGTFNLDNDEQEIELIANLPDDLDTYVEISQEVESDEESFEIEWVKEGETILESAFEIEYDDDIITVSMSYESETYEISYEIEKTSSSKLKIEYEIESLDEEEEGFINLEIFTVNSARVFRFTIEVEDYPDLIIEKTEIDSTPNSL